jgi:subtilisin family serine protease
MMKLSVLMLAALVASGSALAQGRPDGTGDGRYIVKFKDFSRGSANVAAAGGRVAVELAPQGAMAAYLPEAAVRALQNNPNVEYVEMDPRRYPMSETSPWGIAKVQANDPVFTGNAAAGSGPMVCIIDSGLHLGHEDFAPYAGSITGGTDLGRNSLTDSCGHGSHVAGTIAAVGGNGKGVVGVNPKGNLRLHIEKVFDGAACGWSYASGLVAALNNCVSRANAESRKLVINMSLGGSTSSSTENTAFQNAYNSGNVLPIAAAGNAGTTATSYPAGYSSVISVAATDVNNAKATFSQANADVELAAPGVGVLSTTPFKVSTVAAGGGSYVGANLDGAARTASSGALVNGGLCDTVGAWAGAVVLCQRGTNSFGDKVSKVQAGGGTAAIIYNNASGGFAGTLGTGVTSPLPAISISQEDGNALLAGAVGASATVDNSVGVTGVSYNGYEYYDGTSMATPHVAGVAALVWSLNGTRTNAEIRDALQRTAQDLGTAGRDNSFGFGLVRAAAAHQLLQAPVVAPTLSSVTVVTKSRKPYARLTWSGATGSTVDYFRNSTKVNTANDGTQDDGPLTKGVGYTYKVCLTGTTTCSASRTIVAP